MLTKKMIAFTAFLTLTMASAALAEGYDFNPRDRNPGPVASAQQSTRALVSRQAAGIARPVIGRAEKLWLDLASRSTDQ